MKPRLVKNPGTVLLWASSMWAVYGALLIDAGIKFAQWWSDNRPLHWQDAVVPLLLILAPVFRVIPQERVTKAELDLPPTATVTATTAARRRTKGVLDDPD